MANTAEIQARMKHGLLHIQGAGPTINRDYGISVDVEVPEELAEWMGTQDHSHESLAGSEKAYAPAIADLTGEELEVIVEGAPLNDKRGARLVTSDLALLEQFVEQYEG